jgi:hypothetical protein
MLPYLLAIAGGYFIGNGLRKGLRSGLRSYSNGGNVNDYGYFKEITNIPDYDAILFKKIDQIPQIYNNWYGEVKWMTEKEYLLECAKFQDTTIDDQYRYIAPQNVNKIKDNMRNGIKYNMPYLNYVKKEQEGRHRVFAASSLGQELIPILILNKEEDEEDEERNYGSISSMIGVWDDLVEKDGEYFVRFTKGDWKNEDRLLRCVVDDFDYYYLDELITLVTRYKTIDDLIKNKYLSTGLVNKSYIEYDGDLEEANLELFKDIELLKRCVIYKAMINNESLIESCVHKDDKYIYLRILNSIKGDYWDYDTCEEFMLYNRGKEYVDAFELLSVNDWNGLYSLSESDIIKVMLLLDESKKK